MNSRSLTALRALPPSRCKYYTRHSLDVKLQNMSESVVYPPSPEFVQQANVSGMEQYRQLYQAAEQDPEKFWGELASQELHWFQKWSKVLDWQPPVAKWFAGATTNVSYNCLDRHLTGARKNKAAIIWEGEPGDQRIITYKELHRLVCRFASVLKSRGYKAGDRSIIYMPMVPEAAIAMLACARLGITHSVVFGGFSSEALKARILDLGATVVITADGSWRRGKEVRLKTAVDEAVAGCPDVKDVIVYRRTGTEIPMAEGRDTGGTYSMKARAKSVPPSRSTPSIRSTFSTPPAPPESRRAFCTPPPGICCTPR
jgi:Acyl-coenzyme A synthetases/AMP-(fatty) acid ligases